MFIKKLGSKSHAVIAPPPSQKMKSGWVVLEKGQEVGEHTSGRNEELIVILSGTATVTLEKETMEVGAGHVIYIPQDKKHNIKNEETETLKYLYMVCYLG